MEGLEGWMISQGQASVLPCLWWVLSPLSSVDPSWQGTARLLAIWGDAGCNPKSRVLFLACHGKDAAACGAWQAPPCAVGGRSILSCSNQTGSVQAGQAGCGWGPSLPSLPVLTRSRSHLSQWWEQLVRCTC